MNFPEADPRLAFVEDYEMLAEYAAFLDEMEKEWAEEAERFAAVAQSAGESPARARLLGDAA